MKKLSRKLSLSLLLKAAPIFILSLGLLFWQSSYLIHKKAMEHSTSMLNTTLQHVVNYMNTIETSAQSNVWLLEENFNPDSIQSIIQRVVLRNPNTISCSVSAEPNEFEQYGRYFSIYSVNEGDTVITVHEPDYDYFSKTWYKSAIKSGKGCWVAPFSDLTDGATDHKEAVASYCMPIRKGRRIAGVLSADFSFSRLAETVLAAEHPYPDAYFVLIGPDGRYLIHPESSRLFKKTIFSETDVNQNADIIALGHEMTSGQHGTMHITIKDVYSHVSYAPVPGTDWSLALISPDHKILANFNKLTYIIIAISAIGLIIILLLCHNVVRQTIRPLNELLVATKQITDGNYDTPIATSNRHDTIAFLQNSFAKMQQSIKERMDSKYKTINEFKQDNQELENALRLEEEADKKKHIFIQNVEQQIRTPLNVIDGFADVLRDTLPAQSEDKAMTAVLKDDELNNITNIMKQNAVHLNRMVLMLYDSSEMESETGILYTKNDETSCNSVVEECIQHTKTHFPNVNIRFESQVPDSLCLLTNNLYLMRSVRELLYNAAKYSDGKHISILLTQTNNTVLFTVEDVGPGLPDDSRELIFRPFTKAADLSQGLGLGLPLAKHHVESLGGSLTLDNSYRKGCRFIIEMPK